MADVLPSLSTGPLLKGLVLAVGCSFLTCAQGNNVELHRANAAFRGSTDITTLAAEANGLLFNAADSARPPVLRSGNEVADPLSEMNNLIASVLEESKHVPRALHEEGEEEEAHEHTLDKKRVGTVVGAVLVILAVSLLGVFLPAIMHRLFGAHGHSTLGVVLETVCTAFAAGGFWGLALIHVLLEAITSLDGLNFGLNLGPSFMNAAFPLVCAGYAGMLAVEAFAKVLSKKALNRRRENECAEQGQAKLAILDSAVACLALTVHSVFEGMVIGMRDSSLLVWIACISVAGHKWAAAFALSQRMTIHGAPKVARFVLLTIFVLSTPVGAFIGLPLSTMEDYPVVGILNALSAGILIYVASECTADVFGGTHVHELDTVSESDKQTAQLKALIHDEDVEASVAEVRQDGHHHDGVKGKDLEACILLFLGRLLALLAGMGLVFGMMCLHMKNPGHSHSHTEDAAH